MSSEATLGVEPDVYGQLHPVETPELLASKLSEFQTAVRSLTNVNVSAASTKCPGLLTKDFFLLFLRAEVFNTELAVTRYRLYWDKRVELFGDKAFEPLTLAKACSADRVALETGYMQVVELAGEGNRSYMFVDPSKQNKELYTRESMIRAVWYFVHAILTEHKVAHTKGVIFIGYPRAAQFGQFDKHLTRQIMGSIQGILPVRLSAVHICHPPSFFSLIFPIIKLFMNKRMRKRINVHAGSDESVLTKLDTKYDMKKETLPVEMGGKQVLDVKSWLSARDMAGK